MGMYSRLESFESWAGLWLCAIASRSLQGSGARKINPLQDQSPVLGRYNWSSEVQRIARRPLLWESAHASACDRCQRTPTCLGHNLRPSSRAICTKTLSFMQCHFL
ncbi:hypothetical protein EJ03DRAFT_12174 [Teratosphaeria nubilosa]|uniref:Uncharacterized protein n=1 Tax=Teratosphaeria nubilosa TaxID=161662 RepID=A0A6G1LH75_9PEZI|nr:hypothetical protein EJ03DRAFT_12174 [Teratosphaeria nubilosa]